MFNLRLVLAVLPCFLSPPALVAQDPSSGFSAINHIGFSPDGDTIVSAGEDGSLRVWETATGKQSHLLKGPEQERRAVAIAFSPDGKMLASGGDLQPVKLWDLLRGRSTQA